MGLFKKKEKYRKIENVAIGTIPLIPFQPQQHVHSILPQIFPQEISNDRKTLLDLLEWQKQLLEFIKQSVNYLEEKVK